MKVSEETYRLNQYSLILADFLDTVLANPEEWKRTEWLSKLTLSYAQKCLALDNADLKEADNDNDNAKDI
jgi:hypothetical protein